MDIYLDGSFEKEEGSISSISFKQDDKVYYCLLHIDKTHIFIDDQLVSLNAFVSEILAFYLFFDKIIKDFKLQNKTLKLFTDNKTIYELCNYLSIPNKKYNELLTIFLKQKLSKYDIKVIWIPREKNLADLSFMWNGLYDIEQINLSKIFMKKIFLV